LPQRFAASRHVEHSTAEHSTVAIPMRPAATLTLRDLEMQAIHEALGRHNGNKPKAAEELGVSVKTLYNKLNQAGPFEKTA
jgi:transcriptional regulator with PAS, ATPase and Fis domain